MEDEEHQRTDDPVEVAATTGGDAVRTIVVNGRKHRFAGDHIGHGELATLASPMLEERQGRSLVASFGAGSLPTKGPRNPLDDLDAVDAIRRMLDGRKGR